MMYDDVDMNILDSKDTFGVYKTSEIKDDKKETDLSTKKSFKSVKREYTLEPKFTNKFPKKREDTPDCEKFVERKMEISTDFVRTAVTFQEKLAVLEERDKYLRENFNTGNKNMSVIVIGTCPDMCPEKERLLREINCSFSIFEGQIFDNEMHVVPEWLVKEYSRSSADQDEPLPHELRPEPVLIDTMNHIMVNIMPKIEEHGVDTMEWYHFCWDRLRSVRKDIIQQQLCSVDIVRILEQSARFHICCGDLLCGADPKVFDEKINSENLVNCLQMLINMYEDLEKDGIFCENESEFRVYMMLMLLDNGDVPDVIRWQDEESKIYAGEAKEIFFAFKHKLYTRFFKLVKKTSYLNACILQRYFSTMKTQILNMLVSAYSSGSQTAKFPLTFVKQVLEMDNDEETISFVEQYGFTVNSRSNEIRGSKSSFTIPDIKISCGSSYILKNKRLPILEAVSQVSNYSPKIRLGKVHSSFNQIDEFNKAAIKADDQKQKVIALFGDIYNETNEIKEIVRKPEQKPLSSNFSFKIDPKPAPVEPPKIIPQPVFETFKFTLPTIPKPIPEQPPMFKPVFKLPCPESIPEPEIITEPTKMEENPITITPPKILYDPEEPTEDVVDSIVETPPEPVSLRQPEEVVHSLTSALQQFENTFMNFFRSNYEENLRIRKQIILKENRKLRRTVKKRLKRNNARRYGRLWKRKVECIKKERENFIDIVHLPLEEYLNLWGTLKKKNSIPKSIVKEAKDNLNAIKWSSAILNSKSLSVNYIGDKLAEILVSVMRSRCGKLKLKVKTTLCWKVIVSLPDPTNESFNAFVTKVSEFCRLLFYKNQNNLGPVEVTRIKGVKICASVDVRTGLFDENVAGISDLVVYVYELETLRDLSERLYSAIKRQPEHPMHINIIAFDDCYKQQICDHLTLLKKNKLITEWSFTKWDNFFTIPKAILNGAKHIPWTPYFLFKDLSTFIENTSGDFFLSLCYHWNNFLQNNPTTYIKLYNVFLQKLRQTLENESLLKYNLSAEFLPHIIGLENSRDTLTEPQLLSLINKYSLVSFTKWPPKSINKMVKLLTKYCNIVNDEATLLPNILRLVSPKEDVDVEFVNNNAPWLKVVELWTKYNVYSVLKRENVDNVYVIYDEAKIKEITDGLWIYET